MSKLVLVVLVVIYVVSCKSISSQYQNDPSIQNEISLIQDTWIRNKIDSTMEENNIPALSVGIIENGKLASVEGFGYLSRETDEKVDGNTLYQIASDTKKFTGIIVNNLVSEGKVDLDEPIVTYLKGVLSSDGKQNVAGITLKRLLYHRSGIPNREPSNRRIDGDPMTIPFTEEDLINDLNIVKLDFEPNAKFSYSNFGYALVGYICEKVSGQDYSTLVKKYITDKYGMPNTVVYPDIEQSKLIALPYRKDNRAIKSKPWTMGKMTPAGGIYSNVKDASNLMLAQMKVYREVREKSNISSPLILTEESDTDHGHYGFGLAKVVDEYGIHYGHGGDLDGYASGYVFIPKGDLGLIMLTSSGGKWFGQLEKEIRVYLTERNNK